MCHPIVTLSQICLSNHWWIPHDSEQTTEEEFGHCCIVTMTAHLGINLIRDATIFMGLFIILYPKTSLAQ
jgi:hypothetical protein